MRYMVVLLALTLTTAAEAEQRQRGSRPARNTPTPRAEALSRNIPPRLLLPAGSDRFPTDRRRMFFPGGRRPGFHKPGWSRPGAGYSHFGGYAGGGYYAGGYYALPYSDYYPDEDASQAPPPPELEVAESTTLTTGILSLDVTPPSGLQYYVDGVFVGTSSDLGSEFPVNAGARRIEIRANGYKPMVFDARFAPGRTVTQRGALERVPDSSTLPRATGSRTMYVIPGCFIGNTRPEASALPKGCDIRKLTTRAGS